MAKVIRTQKTQKSLRILKTINLMKFQSTQMKLKFDADHHVALDPEQEKHVREVFQLFDKDNSGAISSSELKSLLESLGQQLDEVEAMELVARLDQDGDGQLDIDEFVAFIAATQHESLDLEQEVDRMFSLFDKDQSGTISAEEFVETMKTLGTQMTKEDIDAIMEEVDTDRNGEISKEEFRSLLEKHMEDW